MARVYTVRAQVYPETPLAMSNWNYPADYFPRKFSYKKDAIACAKEAIANGATIARVEFPDGAELDFRPSK